MYHFKYNDQLTQRMKRIQDSIKKLRSDMHFELKYEDMLSDHPIYLGSYLFDEYTGLVRSLKGFFRQESEGTVTNALDHYPDWDMIEFSFYEKSRFRYNPLDYDPRDDKNFPKFSDLSESWLHIPLNNEEWMKVR